MTASVMATEQFLSILVTIGLAVTVVAPVALIVLLIRDWIKGQLW